MCDLETVIPWVSLGLATFHDRAMAPKGVSLEGGRHEIVRWIGDGGNSRVYESRCNGKRYALKAFVARTLEVCTEPMTPATQDGIRRIVSFMRR